MDPEVDTQPIATPLDALALLVELLEADPELSMEHSMDYHAPENCAWCEAKRTLSYFGRI